MKKQFIYFFKHNNITGIKIGRTSGDSVNDRFKSFKTYSPAGAKIIGFFECDNCVAVEKKIHTQLHSNRMSGEFFDITEDHALSIINNNDVSLKKIKYVFNEWISKEENNTEALLELFHKASKVIKEKDLKKHMEQYHISLNFTHGTNFMTTTRIIEYLKIINPEINYNINKIGHALRVLNYERVKKNQVYGYLITPL